MKYYKIKEFSRKLRINPTKSEEKLWVYLRKRQIEGKKFLRQHPIVYQRNFDELQCFIPDFYCAEEKLAIELDGKIHEYQKEKDQHRDEILQDMGLRILRILNEELEDIPQVLKKIKQELTTLSKK